MPTSREAEMAEQDTHAPKLRPAKLQTLMTNFSDAYRSSGYIRLNIPTTYSWEGPTGTQMGFMSRNRADDVIDTVLASFKDAPKETFQSTKSRLNHFPEADEWVRNAVKEYISAHTVQSIIREVPPREKKDYIFPEDMKDKIITINTRGGGHWYKPLKAVNATHTDSGCPNVSTSLNGEHTCEFLSALYRTLSVRYDTETGELVLRLTPDIRLCNEYTWTLDADLQGSYRQFMTDYINSDNPEIARQLGLIQYLNRGELDTRIYEFGHLAASHWLQSLNMTCSEIIERGQGPSELLTLKSKHVDKGEEIGKYSMKGANLVLDDMDAEKNTSARTKSLIRQHISAALQSLSSSKPEETTPAQWAEALTKTAECLVKEMTPQGLGLPQTEGLQPDADQTLFCRAEAELVSTPPTTESAWRVLTLSSGAQPTAWIRTYGELKDANEENRRAPTCASLWLPISGATRYVHGQVN